MADIYKVGRVGGIPLLDTIRKNRNKGVDSIEFDGESCIIQSDEKGQHTKILVNFRDAWLEIDSQPFEVWWHGDEPKELYLNLHLSVTDYTIETIRHPVKMTIDEIEKELGHKVEIVNK